MGREISIRIKVMLSIVGKNSMGQLKGGKMEHLYEAKMDKLV